MLRVHQVQGHNEKTGTFHGAVDRRRFVNAWKGKEPE